MHNARQYRSRELIRRDSLKQIGLPLSISIAAHKRLWGKLALWTKFAKLMPGIPSHIAVSAES